MAKVEITEQQIEALNLGVTLSPKYILVIQSAFSWIAQNTTLEVDYDAVQPYVKLFVLKYMEVMALRAGVSSQGIEGLSQSFNDADIGQLIRQYARDLLGAEYVSDARFVQAVDRWA